MIATISTVVALALVIVVVPATPGWPKVRQAFFDGDVFAETFPTLLEAFWLDVKILLWSTQGTPVEEQQKLRDGVFANFPGGVDFQPQELGPFVTRIEAERNAGTGTIGVVASLHGDLSTYADNWADLSDIDLAGVNVSPAFLELGKPQPVILFELVKGFLTDETPDLGEVVRVGAD